MSRLVFALVLLSACVAPPGFAAPAQEEESGQSGESQRAKDEWAIRASAIVFQAAVLRGDAHAIAEQFCADAEYYDADGRKIQGRQAIEQEFAVEVVVWPLWLIFTLAGVWLLILFGRRLYGIAAGRSSAPA